MMRMTFGGAEKDDGRMRNDATRRNRSFTAGE
jgi:hypothetical protein